MTHSQINQAKAWGFSLLIFGLILFSGCMTEYQASHWKWDGKLSSLDECYYQYIHLATLDNLQGGWNFINNSPANIDSSVWFPADCVDVYNYCINNYQKDIIYYNNHINSCGWDTDWSWSPDGIFSSVHTLGVCRCTLDEFELVGNWYVLKLNEVTTPHSPHN